MDVNWLSLFDKALPTLTFVLGLIGSWITDYLKDSRSDRTSRERESLEFQKKNYLALQEALQTMGRAAGKVLQYEKSLVHADRPVHAGADDELRESVAKVQVLEERIDRSDVRLSVNIARKSAASFGMPNGYTDTTETEFLQVVENISKAQSLVGQSLRSLLRP